MGRWFGRSRRVQVPHPPQDRRPRPDPLYQSGMTSTRRLGLVSEKPLRSGAVAMHCRCALTHSSPIAPRSCLSTPLSRSAMRLPFLCCESLKIRCIGLAREAAPSNLAQGSALGQGRSERIAAAEAAVTNVRWSGRLRGRMDARPRFPRAEPGARLDSAPSRAPGSSFVNRDFGVSPRDAERVHLRSRSTSRRAAARRETTSSPSCAILSSPHRTRFSRAPAPHHKKRE
jgi:hypothetical protein